MEDKEIIYLLKKDEETGLYELIAKYNAYVKSIVCRVIGNCFTDVEECIADTFISVWKKRNSIDISSDSIKGFLACVARNTAINRYKSLIKEQHLELDCESLIAEDEIESLIENIYQNEVVELLLESLKEPHKEIFIRRHILMETIKEICEDMHMDERQIRNSLYRSKVKLRDSLEGGASNEKRDDVQRNWKNFNKGKK